MPPPREPFGYFPIRLQRWKRHSAKAVFAVDEDALVVTEIAELVWFDFVFFGFGIIDVPPAGTESPRPFHHSLAGLNG